MPFDWSDLIDALQQDECVLLLGPHAATYEGESLCKLLSERFVLKLKQKGLRPDILADTAGHADAAAPVAQQTKAGKEINELSLLVRMYRDCFIKPTDALEQLGKTLREFYTEFEGEEIPVYRLVADLPFKFVINTSPDNLLSNVLTRHGRAPLFFDFHYAKPEYNAEMSRKAVHLDEVLSTQTPLLYNLLGHYDRPDSLVLTDTDRLQFLEVALQREREATLPANITYFFTRPPLQRLRKSYIFIGFDFNEWHMRLFMHLLGRSHGNLLPQSIALQNPAALGGDTHTFFTGNFNMHFIGEDPADFLTELQEQLRKPEAPAQPAPMELLLLYHPDDEMLCREMETHLANFKRSGLVDLWHANKIMPGSDEAAELRQHLESARVVVPLVTAKFLADDRLFSEILPVALQRQETGKAKLAPIVMTPCDVSETPLFQLNTFYPKPKGRALSQKPDREESILAIVKDLRAVIENMAPVKKNSSRTMNYRYPGTHSFTADDAELFFGRDQEVKELSRLVVLNDMVVLFSKSGTGKTSLLQAGIGPKLREQYLRPVKLRLNNNTQTISRQIFEQFNDGDYLAVNTPDNLSLWEYCKLFDYAEGGHSFMPVLFLDQFEELFTLYQNNAEAQQDFIAQLADVVNGHMPAHLHHAVKPEWQGPEIARFFEPPKVHILISIRSDYLYLLDRLSERLPAILRCRYELQALDEEKAKQAIIKPARLTGDFDAPIFGYSPAALDNIILNLTAASEAEPWMNAPSGKREIEAFQLQLLCRHIEQKIIDDTCPAEYSVTPDFYKGDEGVGAMLSQFYQNILDQFDEADRPRIQHLVEDKLLSNNRRIIQERNFLKQECQVTDTELRLLTRERLLREEPRAGSFYYEISHDTLVAPLMKFQKARRVREESQQKIAELKEAQRKTLALWQRVFLVVVSIVAVFAVLAFVYAYRESQIAKMKNQEAEKNLADFIRADSIRLAEEAAKERLNFDKYVSNGDIFFNSADYDLALNQYIRADSIRMKFPRDPDLIQKSTALEQKIAQARQSLRPSHPGPDKNPVSEHPVKPNSNEADFMKLLKDSDTAVKKGQYKLALDKLLSAKALQPEKTLEIDLRINWIFDAIDNQRQQAIRAEKEASRRIQDLENQKKQ